MLATPCASSTAPTPMASPFVLHYYHPHPAVRPPPQTAAPSSTASRSPAEACSSASTAAKTYRGGEEQAVVATTAATARPAGVCACLRAWTATSLEDAIHDRPCRVAVVEEESAAAAGLARGGRRTDAMVAGARRRAADQALGPRRPPRSWMLRWKTTSVEMVARLLRTTTVLLNSRTAVERRLRLLRLLLLLETTIST
jgi:hypothetical protein